MAQIIGIIIVLYIVFYLVVYIIAPISGVLLAVSLVLGVSYALYVSIRSFGNSFIGHLRPYTTYVDKTSDAPSGVRRSYFFGPGYHQIAITVQDAFSGQKNHLDDLTDWKDILTENEWYISMWVWIFYIAAYSCTFVFGFLWMVIFSIALSSIIFVGMCGFYAFFTLLWSADRLTLAIKSIQSRCANCKRISIVPVFSCPDCGTEHRNLTPGPYGIINRKCSCGKQLSTTFFNGRSALTASCPFCVTELAASDARQFGIQLVGGVSAGKTTLLAAFWHMYLERLKTLYYMTYKVFPVDAFAELEYWYQQGLSSSTTETNANMYSIVHKSAEETTYQLTVYDIAGEAFTVDYGQQQLQFQYCEGIIFVIDPTAAPNSANETISSFINNFKGLKGKHSAIMSDIPVAVIISKADLYKREIGLPKIKARYKSNPDEYLNTEGSSSIGLVKNGMCKEFLENHGFANVINLIDGEFNNAQYFPVSAMGHTAVSGQPYEPWGVMEPVMWILKHADVSFNETIKHLQEVSI